MHTSSNRSRSKQPAVSEHAQEPPVNYMKQSRHPRKRVVLDGSTTMISTSDMQDFEFRVFRGPINQQIPGLIAAGFVPASAAQIMHGRLEGKLSLDVYYDSGDAILYHPDGRMKLVQDSQDLQRLNAKSWLHSGALVLPDGAWNTLDGIIFSREYLASSAKPRLSKQEVLNNRVWQWLARDDNHLLGEYADRVFSRAHPRSPGHDTAMGIYLSKKKMNNTVLRSWCLGNMDDGEAGGDFRLDNVGSRLVGIEPKAPSCVFGPCATYRDAPRQAPRPDSGKKSRTLWDMIRGRYDASRRSVLW